MIKEALDGKYSYQIDEYGMVQLFRGEEDCQQHLTNPYGDVEYYELTLEDGRVVLTKDPYEAGELYTD